MNDFMLWLTMILIAVCSLMICGRLTLINDNLTELNTQFQIASEAVLGVE